MKVCLAQLPDALELAEQSLSLKFPSGTTWVASRFDDGRLAGVVVFEPLQHGNSCLHMAACSPVWFPPGMCKAVFEWGFGRLGALRLSATVPLSNSRSAHLVRHAGFQLEGLLRGFDFGDLQMFGILKGECKWVES